MKGSLGYFCIALLVALLVVCFESNKGFLYCLLDVFASEH